MGGQLTKIKYNMVSRAMHVPACMSDICITLYGIWVDVVNEPKGISLLIISIIVHTLTM